MAMLYIYRYYTCTCNTKSKLHKPAYIDITIEKTAINYAQVIYIYFVLGGNWYSIC